MGSLGIYRAAFKSIDQTEPLMLNKIIKPVIAMGGIKGLGAGVERLVRMVAEDVTGVVLDDSGHFIPEERPEPVVRQILSLPRA